jgi:hypothetical protein
LPSESTHLWQRQPILDCVAAVSVRAQVGDYVDEPLLGCVGVRNDNDTVRQCILKPLYAATGNLGLHKLLPSHPILIHDDRLLGLFAPRHHGGSIVQVEGQHDVVADSGVLLAEE